MRLAFSWLTVLPVHTDRVDRSVAGRAIALAPVVGLVLGAAAAALAFGLRHTGLPSLVVGLLTVAFLALATRGMHLDGLADTADGLGCYGPPERALAVMKDGPAGPFAVVALVLVLATQAAAVDRWGAVIVAVAAGRASFAWACRHGVPAARPEGLGALVAGTQAAWVAPTWALVLAAASALVVPGRPWQGPLVVAVATAAVVLLTRHTVRRFGGLTGDTLGALSEVATTVVLVVLAAG